MTSRAESVVERTRGPVVPLNICFNDDATVDFGAVRDYVAWLNENGAPILLLTSGSSEYAYLSERDVWRLTTEIAKANAGRALFVAATGWWKVTTSADYLKHADAAGADAVKVQMHSSFPTDRDTYLGYFDRIGSASEIPLWLLDPPPKLAVELASLENVVGAKVHNMSDYHTMTRETRDLNFATVCAGQMRNMVFGYMLGSPAYLCTVAPFAPKIAFEFFGELEAGRYDDALASVFRYEEPWMKTALDVGWLHAIKEAIRLRGPYPNSNPCPPQPATTPEQGQRVAQAMKDVFGLG